MSRNKKDRVRIIDNTDLTALDLEKMIGIGTTPDNWKKQLIKYQKDLKTAYDNEIMLGELEVDWQSINPGPALDYRSKSVKDITGDSPLDELHNLLDYPLTPPPELLMTIDSMYKNYLVHEGEITLEDAFFGPLKKGVGNHAARKANENFLGKKTKQNQFLLFHLALENSEHSGMSQMAILEQLIEEDKAKYRSPENKIDEVLSGFTTAMKHPFFPLDEDFEHETFLRKYRVWRSKVFKESE